MPGPFVIALSTGGCCCTASLPGGAQVPVCSLVTLTLRTWTSLLPRTSWGSRTARQDDNFAGFQFPGFCKEIQGWVAQSGHGGVGMPASQTPLKFSFHLQIPAVRTLASKGFQAFVLFASIRRAQIIIKCSPCSLRLVSLGGGRTPSEGMRVGWWGGHPPTLPGQLGCSSVLRQPGSLSKRSRRESGVHRRPILLVPSREKMPVYKGARLVEEQRKTSIHCSCSGTPHPGWSQQGMRAFPPSAPEGMGIIAGPVSWEGIQLLLPAARAPQPCL